MTHINLDLTSPIHEFAYLTAADTFLIDWPATWTAQHLQDALLSDEEDPEAVSVREWLNGIHVHPMIEPYQWLEEQIALLAEKMLEFASLYASGGGQAYARRHNSQPTTTEQP